MIKFVNKYSDQINGYLFVLPAFLIIGLFGIFPVFFGMYMSVHKWKVFKGRFLGFENYQKILAPNDPHPAKNTSPTQSNSQSNSQTNSQTISQKMLKKLRVSPRRLFSFYNLNYQVLNLSDMITSSISS